MEATSELLRSWALEVGFDRVGVASLEPSRYEGELRAWIARGDHAELSWIERRLEVRVRPGSTVPGAQSALVVALHYHPAAAPGAEEEPPGDLWPRVARYARGRDYHSVMDERLRLLEDRIKSAFPGVSSWRYVDTGPILERELAARAGLGAIGKHTNLVHPEHGSWFLLGELVLSLDLEPDTPVTDPCGSCSRCLTACPTGALPAPYRLDARRCISYWTIEHRGAIPPALRPMLGDWVFGCDLCQEACPWNAGPAIAADPELLLPPGRAELDLAGLLAISEEGYRELFRGSPMKRAKREGLQRNAATAMGNRRDPRSVPALASALGDRSAVVRAHAAWALGQIGGEPAEGILLDALGREEDEEVRRELGEALAEARESQI